MPCCCAVDYTRVVRRHFQTEQVTAGSFQKLRRAEPDSPQGWAECHAACPNTALVAFLCPASPPQALGSLAERTVSPLLSPPAQCGAHSPSPTHFLHVLGAPAAPSPQAVLPHPSAIRPKVLTGTSQHGTQYSAVIRAHSTSQGRGQLLHGTPSNEGAGRPTRSAPSFGNNLKKRHSITNTEP